VISPLLANLYLHWFDKLFHRDDSARKAGCGKPACPVWRGGWRRHEPRHPDSTASCFL